MASITKYSTGDDSTRGTVTYTNPGNVSADDNAVASRSNARRTNSDEYWLIPAFTEVGALDTINSVLVEVQWRNTVSRTTTRTFQFFVGATGKTPTLSGVSDPTALTTQSFSPTLTAADVRGSGNAVLTRFNPDANAATTEIDFVRVTVDYTSAGGPWTIPVGQATETDTALAITAVGGAQPVAWKATTTATADLDASATSVTVTPDASVIEGDLMIASVAPGVTGANVTEPGGWTLIERTVVSNSELATFWKIAGASEGAAAFTWTGVADCAASIELYENADPTSPIAASSSATTTGVSVVAAGVTVPDNLSLLVYVIGQRQGGAAASITPPAGMTERFDLNTPVGSSILSSAADESVNAGATGTRTGTSTSSQAWGAQLIAVRPVATPAGHTVAVGQAAETDTAQAVAWNPKIRLLGQASTADVAQAVTARKARTVGQASEADTAQPVDAVKTRPPIGQAVETDTAQSIGKAKARAVGQAVTADIAQPITARKARTVGQAVETDSARPVTARKARAVAQVLEADVAQPVTARKTRAVGQAVEANTAQPVTARKTRAVGQAAETDTAQPITAAGSHVVAVGQAVEADTAQPIRWAPKIRMLGEAVETDTARAVTPRKTRAVGQTSSTDTARAITPRKSRAVGQAVETSTARAVTVRKTLLIGQAATTDTAFAVTRLDTSNDAPPQDRPTFATLSLRPKQATLTGHTAAAAVTDRQTTAQIG